MAESIRIDSSCGVLTLHIGDRILEINGTPVRNRPLDEIERALGRPDTVIQLTIEQTADKNTKRTQTSTQTRSQTDDKTHDRQTDKKTHTKEDCKQRQSIEVEKKEEGKKERLFKRKGGEDAGRWVNKRRQTPSSPLLGDKEKSSSMSKLLDAVDGDESSGVLNDLARARSFRAEPEPGQKVFRASDLLQGELLGSGFFGEVYKVTHRDTNEVMVLKQLYRVDEDAQRNFLKEVAVLRSLKHRNVLRFVGVLYKDKRLHLVTEYVPGGTLYQLLQYGPPELGGPGAAGAGRGGGARDKTVIVADFGLARVVQRAASSTSTLRRKRYTVVGNPYWMAPEMMNGNVYDEKVDVFSFGIILCEIIGRVSADPDFLPRRSDFGLNEPLFIEKFCRASHCPEAFYRIAFLACHLDPDIRIKCFVISLQASIRVAGGVAGVPGSPSTATLSVPERGWRLGKCVSASHIGARPPAASAAPALCRSQYSLHTAGYILHAQGNTINITKVDDITKWLDPPPLKRTPPDPHLDRLPDHKSRKLEPTNLPAFLRNQSVEELDSQYKLHIHPPLPFCRHISIPNSSPVPPDNEDSDSSDDDDQISTWERNVKIFDQMEVDPKNAIANLVKKGENLLSKKASYDVTDVVLRNPECMTHERKIPEVDCRRYNIDYLTKSPIMAQGVKNISKAVEKDKSVEKEKPQEKSGFFPKKLLSPKFSRLFKPNTAEVVRNRDVEDKDKSRSKFFVQRPASPSNMGRSHRVRPSDTDKPMLNKDVLKSDIKLASMGKPMTPIFRRHLGEKPEFADGRFSYRDRRSKPNEDSKFIELGRNRIKAPLSTLEGTKLTPLIRSSHINNIAALTTVPEKKIVEKKKCDELPKRREPGISRSNYVSLANLKINGKGKDVDEKCRQRGNEDSPVERVM
ncbi:hypothetical protein HF086_003066 [Spodoptera exigua]|uniref:non-specific serine/threonine protein kinase n=1 Tax=Spodoptera exigua TaxID=7107 RepID=A0A922MPX9_SPOEX|nr:hypothetical protein HF086_003066 [Spodoptera exigua]